MIDIFAIRGDGPYWRGPDITEPLICDLSVALERGRVEIDNSSPSRTVQMTIKYRPGLRVGQLVEVIDAMQGAKWRGKITSIDNAIEGAKMTTKISVRAP